MSATTIIEISITRLTDPALDETAMRLVPVINKITVEPLPPAIADFVQKAGAYSAAISQQRISILTKDIQLLDRNRDHTLTELFRDIANELQSKDPATRDAAYALDIILHTYGNPSRRPMDIETNVLRDICNKLTDSSMAAHLTKLPVAKALTTKLQTLNNQFSDLFTQRIAEHEHKEKGLVRRLRKDLETALYNTIGKINSVINLYGDTGLAAAVTSANTILEEAQHLINRMASHRHHEEGEGGQTATGQTAPSGEQQ